jgi:hypothetical protein
MLSPILLTPYQFLKENKSVKPNKHGAVRQSGRQKSNKAALGQVSPGKISTPIHRPRALVRKNNHVML